MHSKKQAPVKYYVGIDVGSASVRAALVDEFGTVVAHADQPIQIWEPQPDHYEQSSADIWAACCLVTKNLQESCWEKAGYFFDLPDFLSWKATGVTARSLCTVVCKWTYTSDGGWDDSFWKMIGLEDLVKDKYEKIGNHVLSPGESVGKGLTPEAAKDLGLPEGIAVGASLIDAHAGGLGVIGADVKGHNLPCENQPITSRVAMICGTSSCHMGVSETPIFVPGVWGPYFSAMVPGLWLNEGGQSATGKLIDHVVRGHVAFPELQSKAAASAHSIYTYLNSHLDLIKKSLPVGFLTVDLHVWPDFHGNRSPLTDLTLKGMKIIVLLWLDLYVFFLIFVQVVGLTLSRGLDELALIYLATIQAIALGTRHILETLQAAGHHINTVFLCGGLSKNPLFVQMHADITGKPVVLSKEVESVLVGAAILGACASGDFASIQEAMAKMGRIGRVVQPNHEHKRFYDKKYEVFLKLVEHQREYRSIMNSF
ncbi:FGGY carbohydrate kinase domain-containing protein isoform X2 [Gavia stellata]|uniref:FGGY carbohydrate kinase domain-containing protein isoform X2 n=1 Tax=Gavia stellata TaxID=37040 RepID=UPI00289F7646|nr:FGGY carbohydrate kinase domain-containing protein isoform X2 [Gavia stellata]